MTEEKQPTIEELKKQVEDKKKEVENVSERQKLENQLKKLEFQKNHHNTLKRTQAIEDTVVGTMKGMFNIFGQGVNKLKEFEEDERKKKDGSGKPSKSFEEELNDSMNVLE